MTQILMPEPLEIVCPADDVPGPPQGEWTYDDYAALPDDGRRYEVLNGVLYMTPAPNIAHQSSVSHLVTYLMIHVKFAGLGRVFVAPTDVELAVKDIPQPDVVVVLNHNLGIITEKRLVGAPDLVVEVASPSTARYDRMEKQAAYARAGVPEYWLADPRQRTVEVLVLGDATASGVREYHALGVFQGAATLPSQVLPGFPVRVEQFFA